jgi:serine/threonine-protein kinase
MLGALPEFIGPYRVVSLLGRGGMGVVYEAIHEKSHERVAVKIISEELSKEPRFHSRFESEIQTLIRLKHPNIVRLIGIGEAESLPFYSMEFVDGLNLHQKLKLERRIEWQIVLDWAIQIAGALKQAHDFGIIHRDLKPANMMVTQANTIKLLDFGISKLFGGDGFTQPGATVGTADFMPPEQAEGAAVSPRSDLYALGAICYACLAGRAPFTGKNIPEILFNIRYGPYAPMNHLAPEVPEEFCKIIDDLLSRDPKKRPATAYLTMNLLQALRAGLRQREAKQQESKLDKQPTEVPDVPTNSPKTSIDVKELPSIADLSDSPYHDATRIEIVPLDEPTKEHIAGGSQFQPQTNSSITPARRTSFTEVSDQDRAKVSIFEGPSPELEKRERWGEILLILGALLACVGGFYYFSQPVNPDRLYEPIEAAILSGDESRLLDIEDQIEAFRAKYPKDSRIDKLEAASEQIAYFKRLRFLQRRSSTRFQGQDAMVCVLREIVNIKDTQVALARSKLIAFQNAYPVELLDKDEEGWFRFATRLEEELESQRESESDKIRYSQLESYYARVLGSASAPEELTLRLRGLIDLYGKEAWAVPIVTKATAELGKLMPKP